MKPTLLLLHGALGCKKNFTPLLPLLEEHYTVHSLDFSGHGEKVSSVNYGIPHFAKELEEYILKHQIQDCKIFGYSMGGYVALKAAAHGLENIQQILTLGTKFDWSTEAAEKEVKMLNPEKMAEKIPKYVGYLKSLHGNKWDLVVKGTAKLMLDLAHGDKLNEQEWHSIKQEVRIALGDKDHMVSLEESKEASSKLSNSDFILLEDWPHPIEKVDMERLQSLILDNLR